MSSAVASAPAFRRYEGRLGMVVDPEAVPLYVPGFGPECLLFLSFENIEGRVLYRAFEGRTGQRISRPQLTLGSARGVALAAWRDSTPEDLDDFIAEGLKNREVQVG